MSRSRLFILVVLTMAAFAGNSLLCRVALRNTSIDPASFTTIRLVAGAIALWLIVRLRDGAGSLGGNLGSALALSGDAILFSVAYLSLPAGTGALLLFGAVQATMIGWGLRCGERLLPRQWLGVILASAGLVGLVLPGISAPSPFGSALMLGAGVGWGVYSLRGRGGGDAIRKNAGNFIRAVPFALLASLAFAFDEIRPGSSSHTSPPEASSNPIQRRSPNRSPRHSPQPIIVACTAPNSSNAPTPADSRI